MSIVQELLPLIINSVFIIQQRATGSTVRRKNDVNSWQFKAEYWFRQTGRHVMNGEIEQMK